MVYYYVPSHVRFGPFAIGGILACNLILVDEKATTKPSVFSTLKALFYSTLAIFAIAIPIFDLNWALSLPEYVQLAFNAINRVTVASGASYFLYCALVPKNHPCHISLLHYFWTLSIWKPISTVSFTSYVFHMRIMQEINFNKRVRSLLGLQVPTGMDSSDVLSWIFYGYQLALITFLVTFPIAKLVHHFVEKPCDAYFRRLVDGAPPDVLPDVAKKAE